MRQVRLQNVNTAVLMCPNLTLCAGRCAQVAEGLNDTAETFLAAIAADEAEVAPSSIYAAAAVLEGVPFINGSPQNTFVPGLIELAVQRGGGPRHLGACKVVESFALVCW